MIKITLFTSSTADLLAATSDYGAKISIFFITKAKFPKKIFLKCNFNN